MQTRGYRSSGEQRLVTCLASPARARVSSRTRLGRIRGISLRHIVISSAPHRYATLSFQIMTHEFRRHTVRALLISGRVFARHRAGSRHHLDDVCRGIQCGARKETLTAPFVRRVRIEASVIRRRPLSPRPRSPASSRARRPLINLRQSRDS